MCDNKKSNSITEIAFFMINYYRIAFDTSRFNPQRTGLKGLLCMTLICGYVRLRNLHLESNIVGLVLRKGNICSHSKLYAEFFAYFSALLYFFFADNVNNGHGDRAAALAALFGKFQQSVKTFQTEFAMAKSVVLFGSAVVEAYTYGVGNFANLFCRASSVNQIALTVGIKSNFAALALYELAYFQKRRKIFGRFAEPAKGKFLFVVEVCRKRVDYFLRRRHLVGKPQTLTVHRLSVVSDTKIAVVAAFVSDVKIGFVVYKI